MSVAELRKNRMRAHLMDALSLGKILAITAGWYS